MPGAVADLADLGVDPDGRPLAGIRYLDARAGGAVAEAPFRSGPGRGVRRTTLQSALADRLAEAGVATEHAAVHTVEHRGDHLLVDGEPAR